MKKKKKKKSWFQNRSAIQNYLKRNVGMLDFVILDIDLALNMYCLRSWDPSAHALLYAIVILLLACAAVSK